MRLRLTFLLISSVSCGAWLFAQGCGGDTVATDDGGNDGTTAPDNNNPPPPDSGNPDVVVTPDTGAPDTGGGDGGVQPDSSSSGLVFSCGNDGGTVTDCSQCQGATEPCVYCQFGDASVMTAQCRPFGTSCNFNPFPPQGFGGCPCSAGDASTCPESYQVCRQGGNFYSCRTCSDSTNNNGLKCKNGGTCDNVDGGCI